jgi:hypothetical protein
VVTLHERKWPLEAATAASLRPADKDKEMEMEMEMDKDKDNQGGAIRWAVCTCNPPSGPQNRRQTSHRMRVRARSSMARARMGG